MALVQRQRLKTFGDAFVGIAEPLFQSQHFFSDNGEPEVAGLDDAGMDRTDCDFMHAIAFDHDEGIWLRYGGMRVGRVRVAAEGE